jgi:CHAT domain-containing protein
VACCPDSESLAAYLDGRLFPEQRERLEEHLAGCRDCTALVAEALRFGAGASPAVRGLLSRRLTATAAALAIATLGAVAWLAATDWQGWRDPRRPLVAATEEARPVVPRLTGGFRWAPLGETQRGFSQPAGDTSRWPIYAAAEEVRQRTGDSSQPDRLAALADAHLLVGNLDPALTTLARAIAADPANPRLQSDLAAVYLARGMDGSSAADLAAALESSSGALELAPDLLEALFNRALALELLGLRGEGKRAWRAYVDAEGDPQWAAEAAERLEALEAEPTGSPEPVDVALRRAAEGGSPELDDLVEAHRFAARRLIERQLLAEWADAVLSGSSAPAQRTLAAAGAIAAVYQAQTGDPRLQAQVHEAIAAGQSVHRLAAAHRALVRGEARIEAANFNAARDELRRAVSLFAVDSVGHRRARLELALCEFHIEGASDALLAETQRMAGAEPGDLASQARLSHMRGVLAANRGRFGEAIGHYLDAVSSYRRLDERDPTTWLSYLLSEVYPLVGDQRNSWRYRVQAIDGVPTLTDPIRGNTILLQSADWCLLLGKPAVAAALLDEASLSGRELLPYQRTGLHLTRAQLAIELGDQDAARIEIARAVRELLRVEDPSLNAYLRDELAAIRGPIQTSPPDAIAALSRALNGFRARMREVRLPGLLLQRARAYRRNDDLTAAERDLRAGIALLETSRPLKPHERIWVDRLDAPSRLYDEMAALALASNSPQEAFGWIERARVRALGHVGALDPVGLSELTAAIDPDTTLLSYAMVDDRLVLWRIDATGARVVPLEIETVDLAAMVDTIDADLGARVWTTATADAATRLYSALIAPAELDDDARRLAIVPADAIASVPFAALMSERGRYLIQDHIIAIAPSATYFLRARKRSLSMGGVGSALVLADPSVDDELFPGLSRLPGAAKELRVADFYRLATRLTRGEATRDALFMALGEHSVVHLATHALVDDALPSRSALALAPTRRGDGSGALYADEIPALSLPRTRTVVLAACGGSGGPLAGTAGRLSLARAFLAAGVPEVVAALWPVGDQRSVALLTALHARLSTGDDAASALRSAQLQLLTGNDPVLRSPATWALFEALGG